MQINALNYDNKVSGDWDDKPLSTTLDGLLTTRTTKRHFWKAQIMSAADYEAIEALRGTVVRLETTDYASRNTEKWYTAEIRSVTGTQSSVNMTNVQIEFYILRV